MLIFLTLTEVGTGAKRKNWELLVNTNLILFAEADKKDVVTITFSYPIHGKSTWVVWQKLRDIFVQQQED